MAGSYTYVTLTQAIAQLAALLDVPVVATGGFWNSAELTLYLIESIRTFSGLSRFFRERGTFNLSSRVPYYDLTVALPALRGYNVTDRDLVGLCQYHLLEPFSPTAWTGTDQFSLSDLADALTRRTNQFLLDTQCRVSVAHGGLTWDEAIHGWDAYTMTWDDLAGNSIVMPSPPGDRIPLPDQILATRHANWQDSVGNWYSLWESDQWAIDAGANSLARQAPAQFPVQYSVSETPQLVLRMFPAPDQSGQIELITVDAIADFQPQTEANLLRVPDDYAWAVKWGALADLLGRDGQARDPMRAKYCEMRYQEGVIACRAGASMLDVQLNGAPFWMTSYTQMQNAMPTWRANLQKPTFGAMLGQNLIAFGPVPDSAYSVSMDVARNAIVPVLPGDFIQVGREQLDVILGYARHLAAFKMGGTEFEDTFDGWQRMVKLGVQMNSVLRAHSTDLAAMRDLAILDREFHPDQSPSPEKQLATQ